ncbi:hypothetical protein IWQ56_001909, partial [Coemansia nantahalensis]
PVQPLVAQRPVPRRRLWRVVPRWPPRGLPLIRRWRRRRLPQRLPPARPVVGRRRGLAV